MTIVVDDDLLFDDRLGTYARGIEYDFKARRGRLLMEEDCCCDMGECIELFERIDRRVVLIETLAGDKKDTCYRRTNEKWRAIPHE